MYFLPCALLAEYGHAQYAGKILADVSSLGLDTHPQHKHFIALRVATKLEEDLKKVSSGTHTIEQLKDLHRTLVQDYRIRTDMINQERAVSVLTNITAKGHSTLRLNLSQPQA